MERRQALLFLFGGCASVTGCASPTLEECNPANKGFFRYMRCGAAYDQRIHMLQAMRDEVLVLRAEVVKLDALAEEADRVGRDSAELRARVDVAIKEAIRALELARDQARKADETRAPGRPVFSGSPQESEIGSILLELISLLLPGPLGIAARVFRASRAVRRAADFLDEILDI